MMSAGGRVWRRQRACVLAWAMIGVMGGAALRADPGGAGAVSPSPPRGEGKGEGRGWNGAEGRDPHPNPLPGREREVAASGQQTVTNVWIDVDVRQVLQDIALQSNINIIADQTVQGIVSLAVRDMPVEGCLERVCAVGGYGFLRVADYYIVGRADPGTDLFRRLALLERVKLRYVPVEQVKGMLPATLAPYVTYDKANAVLLVNAPETVRQRVLEAIRLIDSPNAQMAVDAVVFELSEEGSRQLGLDWQYERANLTLKAENLIGTVTYDVSSDMATYVEATLRAIVQDQNGQVLANPRIVVLNGKEAEIFVGQEKYFSLLSGYAGNPYYRLESIKSGVTLKVNPSIGADGQAVLEFEAEVSDVINDWTREPSDDGKTPVNGSLPVVTRRRARTSVAVRDGQTVVIGGLLRDQHRRMVERIPLLGDIPILGAPFRTVRDLTEQKEVVILLTSRLMTDAPDRAEVARPFKQLYVSPLDGMAVGRSGGKGCQDE